MKGLIGFISGAAISAGVTYILTKRFCNKKNDAELEAMKKYYEDKYGKSKADILREKAEVDHNAPVTHENASEEALKLKEKKSFNYDRIAPVNAPMTDYMAKYKAEEIGSIKRKESDDPPEVGDKPWRDGDIEDQMADELIGMVIISDAEYDEDDEYAKREITYFENDEIFTDEHNHEMLLTVDDVGRPNLEHFGITGEEGVLYCRDTMNMVDYKINLEDAPYESTL